MPELPEVEVVRRGLAAHLASQEICAVDVCHPRAVRRHAQGAADFAAQLVGRTLAVPRRRGKYLWFPLDNDDAILAHLGMSGQFRVDDQARQHRHLRICFQLTDLTLAFIDQRMFGGMLISPQGALLPAEIAHIGADPFEPGWQPRAVAQRIHQRRTGIKRALLDQRILSGVGNIYADEALWLAKVHPESLTSQLPVPRIERVLLAVREVMLAALEEGGTSFDSLYVNVNGESGYFTRFLHCYSKAGEPCDRCGAPIRREPFMNRSSYFCPVCQRPSTSAVGSNRLT